MGRAVKYLDIKIPESEREADLVIRVAALKFWAITKRGQTPSKGVFIARLVMMDPAATQAHKWAIDKTRRLS